MEINNKNENQKINKPKIRINRDKADNTLKQNKRIDNKTNKINE